MHDQPVYKNVAHLAPLLALIALLYVGCAQTGRSTLTQQQRDVFAEIVDWEAGRFSTCRVSHIDLDKDGAPETVMTFRVGSYGSQIRALKWRAGKYAVLFENGSNTPNTAFCLAEGVPTIVLERTESVGREAVQLVYQWDGEDFVQGPNTSCSTSPDQIAWEACE